MGKQGPCCHCGISTTPLWRNGPPEKPVLCNACGSRWKTKGTLLNYMPMHSGGFGANANGSADLKWSRGRKGSHKHSEQGSQKQKGFREAMRETGQSRGDRLFSKVYEEDFARSCSGPTISNSEGSVRRSSSSTTDVLPVLGPLWNIPLPSRKRSATSQVRTPVYKLMRFLTPPPVDHNKLLCSMPAASSEALLVEYAEPSLASTELDLGRIVARSYVPAPQEFTAPQESESETPSFLIESTGNDYSTVLGQSEFASLVHASQGSHRGSGFRGKEKAEHVHRKAEAEQLHNPNNLVPNKSLLENYPYNKRNILQSCQSPLAFLDMKDLVNFDAFTGLLTEQEQGKLMQFVSSADVARIPESLKSMFSSSQFHGALAYFQRLLLEGVFDSSEPGINPRLLQHFQQLLTATDLSGSGWNDRNCQLQSRYRRRSSVDFQKTMQNKDCSKDKWKVPSVLEAASSISGGSYRAKQFSNCLFDKVEEDTKASKANCFLGTTSSALASMPVSTDSTKQLLFSNAQTGRCSSRETLEADAEHKIEGSCFISSSEREPDIAEFMDLRMDSSEADSLLFDVPNPMSFQQAELLQTQSVKADESDANQVESGGLIMSNTWHTDTSPAGWSLVWNSYTEPTQALPNGTVLNPWSDAPAIESKPQAVHLP